jgi:protein phosphatase
LNGHPLLLVLADGMGGYDGGAIASRLVVDQLSTVFQNSRKDVSPLVAMQAGITAAHLALHRRAAEDPRLGRMGSTVVAAAIRGCKIYLANVGDSRAYLISRLGVRQISVDHTLVGEQMRQGVLTESEMRAHPRRNVLSMSISAGRDRVEPFTGMFEWQRNDVLLLCSDGLWGPVSEAHIQSAVLEMPPQKAARQLVYLANNNQGPDNISVIVARNA